MDDLKIIKKKYGEEMMRFCRKSFPTILDNYPGLLSQTLIKNFDASRDLYIDIKNNNLESKFVNFINSFFYTKEKVKTSTLKTPEELLKEAGYTLYKCETEDEIQSFRKYYHDTEELCTFREKRLEDSYVFFAVKDNADEIKRADFTNPIRDDEYGTSVISIQFTKDEYHILSIKNRYNHRVRNPDATFSNNLDNIIGGLTKSFDVHYGLKQRIIKSDFDIPGYVIGKDNKYYKYNYLINKIYYCQNNIILNNLTPKKYDEKYLIMDYFVLDLKNKKVNLVDEELKDGFVNINDNIKKIEVQNIEDGKRVIIYLNDEKNIIIKLDKNNRIISMYDNYSIIIEDNFLSRSKYLKEIILEKTKIIKNRFLNDNTNLKKIELPLVEEIGDSFLYFNTQLKSIFLPNIKKIKSYFLYFNESINKIIMPKLEQIEDFFMYNNKELNELYLEKIKYIGNSFLNKNKKLKILDTPELEKYGDYLLELNMELEVFNALNLKEKGKNSLKYNKNINQLINKENKPKNEEKKKLFEILLNFKKK